MMAIFERTSEGIFPTTSSPVMFESTVKTTEGVGDSVGAMTRTISMSHRLARTVRTEGNSDGKSELDSGRTKQAK